MTELPVVGAKVTKVVIHAPPAVLASLRDICLDVVESAEHIFDVLDVVEPAVDKATAAHLHRMADGAATLARTIGLLSFASAEEGDEADPGPDAPKRPGR